MRHALGPNTTLSYCTNVHPAASIEDLLKQLAVHGTAVREHLDIPELLDIGLWIPRGFPGLEALAPGTRDRGTPMTLDGRLRHLGLRASTANAFPIQDFHAPSVKHAVYEPDWATFDRLHHTLHIAEIMLACTRSGESASVSTLPLGWPGRTPNLKQEAGEQLRTFVRDFLAPWRSMAGDLSGRHITLDLEPEPGCILQRADDAIAFFDHHLPEESHRNHIGICHDICHAAVMFEDQTEVLRKYADAGIRVNKVQISNAIEADFREAPKADILAALRPFAEERYLHQTMLETEGRHTFFEDLPDALGHLDRTAETPDRLRVHYHVPLYLDRIGPLRTTQNQILPAIRAARELHDCKHFEIETYAWNVLPKDLKRNTLAEGIADEFQWVLDNAKA